MCFYSLFHDKIKEKRGDPTEIGHSREGASTKAYVMVVQQDSIWICISSLIPVL